MKKIKLYSYPTSPYAQKVSCYLHYKKLDFEFVPVNPMTNAEIAFTQQRQLPQDQLARNTVIEVDQWVSQSLIPSVFRYAVEWQNPIHSISNGWRLSKAVSNATKLPFYARFLWPFAVKKAKFIVDMVDQMDLTETLPQMNIRLQNEFIEHLNGGPFLAGQQEVSLADLSAFPPIVNSYFMGMKTKQALRDHPEVLAWAKRVHEQLPNNPFLVPEHLLERTFL